MKLKKIVLDSKNIFMPKTVVYVFRSGRKLDGWKLAYIFTSHGVSDLIYRKLMVPKIYFRVQGQTVIDADLELGKIFYGRESEAVFS